MAVPLTHAPRRAHLSEARRRWVAEMLLDGRAADLVVRKLVEAGEDVEVARAEVEGVEASPVLGVARRRLRAHRLRREVGRAGGGHVDVRPDLDARTFRDVYVTHGVPVLAPGFCAGWPCGSWTPEGLAERLGDVELDVCVGREAVAAPERRFRELTRRTTLRAYVEAVRAAGVTNDLYTIANHRNLDGPLAPLLDDVTPPEGFVDRARLRGSASFWLGPAGTLTPLHHDTSSVLFCQVYGEKRVRLVPPWADRVAASARDFYAAVDLDDPAARAPSGPLYGVPVSEVRVRAGDALLLPAGWWHEVRAESVSISLSLVALPFPNRFDFFVAGAP